MKLGKEVFFQRREQLKTRMNKGDAILMVGYPNVIRNNDNHHLYRQESSLFYFSGIKEEEVAILIRPGMTPEYTMFVRPKDALAEMWDGNRAGVDGAVRDFGADESYEISMLPKMLSHYLKDCSKLYYQLHLNEEVDHTVLKTLEEVRTAKGRTGLGILPLYDSTEITGDIRSIKSDEEIELMRKSGKIAAQAHIEAMKYTTAGKNERQIQGVLSYIFHREGANDYAYHPIVAAGNNATVLHYRDNDASCEDGELMLIDAGCELEFYASDITRTFPINGKFSKAQLAIYEAVLKAQKEVIALVAPGTKFIDLQNKAIESISTSLHELDLLEESVEEIIEQKLYRKYYPHNIGHWLGLDVHDRGRYFIDKESRELKPGMVLTVEPGIYVPKGDKNAPSEYRGIGVRIEDDILVTESGHENLTKDVPREVSEIENLMKEESFFQ